MIDDDPARVSWSQIHHHMATTGAFMLVGVLVSQVMNAFIGGLLHYRHGPDEDDRYRWRDPFLGIHYFGGTWTSAV